MAHRPLIYLITSRHQFRHNPEPQPGSVPAAESAEQASRKAQLAAIQIAAEAGCQLVQIREKDLTARELCEFVRAAISIARPFGARVLVNDRLDVALLAGADGVHLRATSLPADEVRAVARGQGRDQFLIGVSTHTLSEAESAAANGADFIVFGPVWSPLSKQVSGSLPGLSGLAAVCRAVDIPVLGLGGIEMDKVSEVLSRGGAGVAAISLFADLNSLAENVRLILESDRRGSVKQPDAERFTNP
ncbi:MAG: thiamine phosphate synthase [Blastocatellia bacterium]